MGGLLAIGTYHFVVPAEPTTAVVERYLNELAGVSGEVSAEPIVRVQGMTQADAAAVLGVSVKTVQRRLARSLPLLAGQLRDLQPQIPYGDDAGASRM